MRMLILCILILATGSYACAEDSEPARIFEFAESQGAGELVHAVYEASMDGEISAWDAVIDWIKTKTLQPVKRVLKTALSSIVPVMLLAMVRACIPGGYGGGEGAGFLLRILLLLGFFDLAELSLTAAEKCIHLVKDFTDAAAPGIAAILNSIGMNGMASLASPAAALTGGIAEGIFLKYGVPLCKLALCSAIAGSLSEIIDLSRFTKLMKKTANWGTGLISTLFTAMVALQGSVTEAIDTVGVRTAKFAADSAAPVIGNGVTDAWESFVSGVMITKNALGVSGLTALLAVGLQPLLCCISAMLALNLIAALLELFGERETARAAEQVGGICQMALSLSTGALVITAVLLGAAMSAGKSFFA